MVIYQGGFNPSFSNVNLLLQITVALGIGLEYWGIYHTVITIVILFYNTE